MPDRSAIISAFIDRAGWGDAERRSLAGDASNRRYLRLSRAGGTAVLMDAPSERGEDVRPFLKMSRYLAGIGLSAPRILAEDAEAGLLLIEDLGDALFRVELDENPTREPVLYSAAADLLADLHTHDPPEGLRAYDPEEMASRSMLAFDWYRLGASGEAGPDRMAFHDAMADTLARIAPETSVTALLDYHAENLIWLPSREGNARVGLLDYQDAMRAHPAYDLVSLVTDARRDVSDACRRATIARFLDQTGHFASEMDAAIAVISVQRNLRIIGIFSRLCMRDSKPGYLRLIPRVWAHVARDMCHPKLSDLRKIIDRAFPEPTPAVLHRLGAKCPTTSP